MVNIIQPKVLQCYHFSQVTSHVLSQNDGNHDEPEEASHQQ